MKIIHFQEKISIGYMRFYYILTVTLTLKIDNL
jgi:hypothetical protein